MHQHRTATLPVGVLARRLRADLALVPLLLLAVAVEIAEAAASRGVTAIDAPVSGGDTGARNAALSIMIGGDHSIGFPCVRGIAQCINLKSPHLVSIFDVRQSSEGDYFVVMEYISGPSLRQLVRNVRLAAAPARAERYDSTSAPRKL